MGGILRDSAGRLLLVQRAHDPGRGLWSLPGGRVEPGESDAAALRREILEETGLTVRVGRLVGSVRRPAPTGTYLIFDYACDATGGTLRPGDDATDTAWVDAAAFAALDLTPQLADTLDQWGVAPA